MSILKYKNIESSKKLLNRQNKNQLGHEYDLNHINIPIYRKWYSFKYSL